MCPFQNRPMLTGKHVHKIYFESQQQVSAYLFLCYLHIGRMVQRNDAATIAAAIKGKLPENL